MAITGYQFDGALVPAAKDASVLSAVAIRDNSVLLRGDNLKVTMNGLQAVVGTGQALIQGRLVEVTSPEAILLPANTTGTIVLVVDLTKTNTIIGVPGQSNYSCTVNQVYVAAVTGAITRDDLHNGGYIYELPLATFTSTATGATIKQTNTYMGDTGWKDLPRNTGADYASPSSFGKYRVVNGWVQIRINRISVFGANNGNQIAYFGSADNYLYPSTDAINAITDYGNDNQFYGGVLHMNTTGTLYADYTPGHQGALTGTLTYPLDR